MPMVPGFWRWLAVAASTALFLMKLEKKFTSVTAVGP